MRRGRLEGMDRVGEEVEAGCDVKMEWCKFVGPAQCGGGCGGCVGLFGRAPVPSCMYV